MIKDDCLIWMGATCGAGYGVRSFNGKQHLVHRIAMMEFLGGPIPKGLVVAHKCDTPACHNINHLFLCTQKENMEDMKRKGRSAKGEKHRSKKHPELVLRGSQIGNSKLTEEDVQKIRKMYVPRKVSLSFLAKEFGIAFQTVSKIVNNKRWAHVQGV